MASEELLQQALTDGAFKPIASEYWWLYLGEKNWDHAQQELVGSLKKSFGDDNKKIVEHFKKSFAFTVLAPLSGVKVTSSVGLLLTCRQKDKWPTYYEKDWPKTLFNVLERDLDITKKRRKLWVLGRVDPFDLSPFCREAYNRMYDHAERAGAITPETKSDLEERFKTMIWVYGGAVLANLFLKHEDKIRDRVLNWNTPYFLEHVLYDVYNFNQLVDIKKTELSKTNKHLIKRI